MRWIVWGMAIFVVVVLIAGGEDDADAPEGDLAVTAGKADEEAESKCAEDWRECSLLQSYIHNGFVDDGRSACKRAAQEAARFGEPELPWRSFNSIQGTREEFMRDDIIYLIEDDAQFQNGFGAMQNVKAVCKYSLRTGTVLTFQTID